MLAADSKKIEVIDDAMARVLRQMSGAQRLRIASGMFASARRWITSAVTREHPDWPPDQVRAEVARRLSHGAVSTTST